ncbi:MAG: hypothetical protein HY370_03820 [Proteobacteria bacterium]|nr:hypothetical protein [Pseudomonadota bacterium]
MKWIKNPFNRKLTPEERENREKLLLREKKFIIALKYATYARKADPARITSREESITDEERQNAINNMGRIVLQSDGFLAADMLSLFGLLCKDTDDNIRSDVAIITMEVGMKFKEAAAQAHGILESMKDDRDMETRMLVGRFLQELEKRSHAPG